MDQLTKQIVNLTRLGMCAEHIAEHLEVPEHRVRSRLRTAYSRIMDEQAIEQAKNKELDILENMRRPYVEAAAAGHGPAANVALQVHDRIARLTGMNAPEKKEISGVREYVFNFLPPKSHTIIDAECGEPGRVGSDMPSGQIEDRAIGGENSGD